MKAPNDAGVPSVSDSVAGTVPPTGAVGSVNAPASVMAAVPPTIGSDTLLARVSSVIGCAALADGRDAARGGAAGQVADDHDADAVTGLEDVLGRLHRDAVVVHRARDHRRRVLVPQRVAVRRVQRAARDAPLVDGADALGDLEVAGVVDAAWPRCGARLTQRRAGARRRVLAAPQQVRVVVFWTPSPVREIWVPVP